jgi:imidazolonepropionase-like amidohydrolase
MNTRWFSLLLAACAAAVQPGICQSSAPAAPVVPKITVVRAGHLLDVNSGKTLENQQIVIEGDKIVSVGPFGAVREGARVIELPNATVLPGLIDAHTHLTGDPKGFGYESLGISTPREALIGA